MPYISTIVLTLPIYSLQHPMSRHYHYPDLTDEEIEVQRLKITELVGDTAGFWTHAFCSGVKLLTIMHSASCDRWLGMKSQKYKRLFRAPLVQWSSHWPLENQVQVVNTNSSWLWFNKSRAEPRNLHFLKLPKVQILEKPLVWSKTPWWTHEVFYKQNCLYWLALGGVLF